MENISKHRVSIDARKNGIITGVLKVISFDVEKAELKTDMGKLTIKGDDLHMSKLDSDACELEFSGCVNSLEYSDNISAGKTATKVFGRLFR